MNKAAKIYKLIASNNRDEQRALKRYLDNQQKEYDKLKKAYQEIMDCLLDTQQELMDTQDELAEFQALYEEIKLCH